jgi:hypothetical protein
MNAASSILARHAVLKRDWESLALIIGILIEFDGRSPG